MNVDQASSQELKDNHNYLANGRQPQFFEKRKTTSIFWKMEDDLNFGKMEDDLNFFGKWKTTSIFGEMEDDLI